MANMKKSNIAISLWKLLSYYMRDIRQSYKLDVMKFKILFFILVEFLHSCLHNLFA